MSMSLPALRAAARVTSRTAFFAVAAAALGATPALAAESVAPSHVTVALDSSRGIARRTPDQATASEIQRHRDSANAAYQAGEFRRARREFATTARLMREAGMLPADEMQIIAAIDFSRGHTLQAAQTADLLVADAITFGNPDVQVRALLDAIWLYVQAGQRDIARERVATLRPLLSSPFISAGTRAEVAARTTAEVATAQVTDKR